MKYLIQGMFFQENRFWDIQHRSEVEGGVGVVIKQGLFQTMFAGIIFPNPIYEDKNSLIGEMLDIYGPSTICLVSIEEDKFSFSKIYFKRSDEIQYQFEKRNGLWIGNYQGDLVGSGNANCILTEVKDELFLPKDM